MFYEALQMVHNNQRNQVRSRIQSQKAASIGSSTNAISKMTTSKSSVNFGSSVAIHKLRESKWFSHAESKILCSVVESGFILERRLKIETNNSEEHEWGIAIWKTGQEKSKNIEYVSIYTAVFEKDKFKVVVVSLKDFWFNGSNVRINNQDDKNTTPNYEVDIEKQVQFALKNKNMKWHNSHHFVHWCRYTVPNFKRVEQITERVKWNNLGVAAGMLMVKKKFRRTTTN